MRRIGNFTQFSMPSRRRKRRGGSYSYRSTPASRVIRRWNNRSRRLRRIRIHEKQATRFYNRT